MDEYQTELESTKRIKNEVEYRATKTEEENVKMHRNYEVLKEHELSIIRDIQEKKIADLRELNEQINSLKRSVVDRDESIKQGERVN